MDERKDGAEGQGNPNRPVEDERLVRFGRYRPHGGSEDEQDDETRPFESATRAGMHVRLFVAGGTKPAFVEAEWKKRNPENVVGVEGANLHGAARLEVVLSRKAHKRTQPRMAVAGGRALIPNNGGWSALNLTTEGAPPFRVCFLKGWAILLFALS